MNVAKTLEQSHSEQIWRKMLGVESYRLRITHDGEEILGVSVNRDRKNCIDNLADVLEEIVRALRAPTESSDSETTG
jgi:ribosome maturation factor RimP